MTALLDVSGVWKSFDEQPVLRGLDLQVKAHEVVVLIGASGSGKSTLLRCVNGLESVDAGRIVLDGTAEVTDLNVDLDRVRRRVGIVFQSYNLFPHMTVIDNVEVSAFEPPLPPELPELDALPVIVSIISPTVMPLVMRYEPGSRSVFTTRIRLVK